VLTHLTQLKELHLKGQDFETKVETLALCLAKCPESLHHLKLQGWGSRVQDFGSVSYRVPNSLFVRLTAEVADLLPVHIELVNCRVSLSLFEYFSGLTRLSLNSSSIHTDALRVDLNKLTNLVHLDIGGSMWAGQLDGYPSGCVADSFVGWPALRILNINNSGLFSEANFDIPSVSELTTDFLKSGLSCPSIHLQHRVDEHLSGILTTTLHPEWAVSLMSVQLSMTILKCTASYLGDALNQILQHCTSLQALDISNQQSASQLVSSQQSAVS